MPDVNPQCRGGNGQRYHTRAVITHAQAKGMDWVGGYRRASIASSSQHAAVYMNVPWFVLSAINIAYIAIISCWTRFTNLYQLGFARNPVACPGFRPRMSWWCEAQGGEGAPWAKVLWKVPGTSTTGNFTWLSPCQKPLKEEIVSQNLFRSNLKATVCCFSWGVVRPIHLNHIVLVLPFLQATWQLPRRFGIWKIIF